MPVRKEIFNQCSVHSGHSSVMDSESVGQQILQLYKCNITVLKIDLSTILKQGL
jgi:hypothetical protein